MAQWHFWDENGYKIGPVRGRDLKRFAQEGMITPETRVEDENGRTALAKNVTGLSFHGSVLLESSTVVMPPSAVKPFVAPVQAIPQSVPVPVVEESEKSSRLITVIGIIAVAVIGVIGVAAIVATSPPKQIAEVVELVEQVIEDDPVNEQLEQENVAIEEQAEPPVRPIMPADILSRQDAIDAILSRIDNPSDRGTVLRWLNACKTIDYSVSSNPVYSRDFKNPKEVNDSNIWCKMGADFFPPDI